MKSTEFTNRVHIQRFPMHYGRRPKSFEKLYWNPFIKELSAALKAQKGKWDGYGYSFPSQEHAIAGQAIMDSFKAKWDDIEKEVPEGKADIDAAIASDYFNRNK